MASEEKYDFQMVRIYISKIRNLGDKIVLKMQFLCFPIKLF